MKAIIALVALLAVASIAQASDLGFHHAQNGNQVSITVEKVSKPDRKALKQGMAYWNNLAGWSLMKLSVPDYEAGTYPEIVHDVVSDCDACAAVTQGQDGFIACHYHVTYHKDDPSTGLPRLWQVYAHELGHCLGFPHQADGIMYNIIPDEAFDRQLLVGLGYTS